MSNFHPREVVDRGSDTQFHIVKKLSYLIQRFKGVNVISINVSASFLHCKADDTLF